MSERTDLTVVRFADLAPASWDEVVRASPDGWVWSLAGWQRLILAVDEWGLEDHSFAMASAGRLVGVMPLQYRPATRTLGCSGWGATVPALDPEAPVALQAEARAAMMARVDAIADACGATEVVIGRVAATATAANGLPAESFGAFGFEDRSGVSKVVGLDATPEEIWRGFAKNARQMIKKAERLGYRAARADWPGCVDEYYRVHCETYARTGVPPHPKAYFAGLAREMSPSGHAVLYAAWDPAGRMVAFHNDARLGPGALYHTGCCESAHLDSGVNYLLMWRAMVDARAAGCQWYEVGEVFPEEVEGKARGLTVFKSKFGGSLRPTFKARRALAAAPPSPAGPGDPPTVEQQTRSAYATGALYAPGRICRRIEAEAVEYVDRLLEERMALVAQHDTGGRLVDLCCATGGHLIDLTRPDRPAIGIDFSARYLEQAAAAATRGGRSRLAWVQADARRLPLEAASVDLLYCFSSLYAIPRADEVVAEVGRVLAPGGSAVLDFGNRRSLNVFCLRYYTEWPPAHPMTLGEIRGALAAAGLEISIHRRFQLLPLWTDRPSWLWPLLHPVWKRWLSRRVAGRMLDEWVSSLPLLRQFAFRHLLVCRKVAA